MPTGTRLDRPPNPLVPNKTRDVDRFCTFFIITVHYLISLPPLDLTQHDLVVCRFCRSVAGIETAAPVPDTIERAQRRHRRWQSVRPEVRKRDGRRAGRRPRQGRGEFQRVGEQQAPDVDEQELHGVADNRSERTKPPVAAQDMTVICARRRYKINRNNINNNN